VKIRGLSPPRLRTLDAESDRSATWLELFYDLAFVVAVAVLGGRLASAHDFSGVLAYFGFFLLIWWLWASHTFYADRYDTDDLAYRILATLQLAGVAVLAASLSGDAAESSLGFAIGYTVSRAVLVAMYWRARVHVPETRKLVTGYLTGFGSGAAIWAISIFTPEPARYVLWAVALCVDLATPWVVRKEQARVPLDVSHLPERFGLFTILVLGESIAATVLGLGHVEWTPESTFTAVMALVIVTAFWWLYFDNVEGAVIRRDPNKENDWRPTIWIYSHLGIAAGLGVVAVGLEHAIVEAGHGAFHGFERWLLLWGVAIVLGAVAFTHFASGSEKTSKLHDRMAYMSLAAAGLALLMGFLESFSAQAISAALAALLVTTAATSPSRQDV